MRPGFALAVAAFMLVVALLYGASAGYFESDTSKYAIIDDVTHMKHIAASYCLISVDDRPVERRMGRFITMVPVALVLPGDRTLRLRLDRDAPASVVTINARLEPGHRYRLELVGRNLRVVEDQRYQNN